MSHDLICPDSNCLSNNIVHIIDNTYKCETCKLYFKIEPKRKNFRPYDMGDNVPTKIKEKEKPVL